MLIELSCSNFKSIRDKIIFSMVASNDKSHEDELYTYKDYRVLRVASIYGANGAGKTTLIDAVAYMCFMVRKCTKFQEGDKIPRMPHKLAKNQPTSFDVQFIVSGLLYAYGFSVTDDVVVEEYLYHFPAGRQAKIFERSNDEITFGAKYKKELSEINTKSKSNKLFLSTAESWSNLAEILNPFKFFKEDLVVHSNGPDNWFEYSAEKIKSNEKMKNILINFLHRINLPVVDIKVKSENRALTPQDMSTEVLNRIQALAGSLQTNVIEIKFVYKDYELDLQEESQGTQKLFRLICPLLDVLVNGKVLFYDELESSLHPAIVDNLIKTFKKWNGENEAQLVFSTHDTSLLDLDTFRRDQIWFAERNPITCSAEYYSLVELKNVRKDDNIKKGYINGRYSSIPLKGSSLIEVLEG